MDCLSLFWPRRVASHGPWKERPKKTTLGSEDRGDRLMPAASSEAAVLSASDRSGFEGALYGFAGALQGLRARSVHLTGLLRHCSRRALHRLTVLHRIGEAVVVRIHLDHFELGDGRVGVRHLDRHRRQHLSCDLLRRTAASVEGEDAVVRIEVSYAD